MELNILVCTHGRMCEELIKSVEMIGGELKNTVAVPLLSSMSMDDYYNAVSEKMDENKVNLCLTDLFGGTPCNTLLSLSREYKVEIICGVNLPVLLETTMAHSYSSVDELKEHLVETYENGGFDVLKRMENNYGN